MTDLFEYVTTFAKGILYEWKFSKTEWSLRLRPKKNVFKAHTQYARNFNIYKTIKFMIKNY